MSLHLFVQNLRSLGFTISVSELIDANRLLLEICTDEDELRLGLRMLFAKNLAEQKLFDLVWMAEQASKPVKQQYNLFSEIVGGSNEDCNLPGIGNPSGNHSEALIRYSSAFNGAAKQLILGNPKSAAAIVLRIAMADSYKPDDLEQNLSDGRSEITKMLSEILPGHADQLIMQFEEEMSLLLKDLLSNPLGIKGKNPLIVQKTEDIPLLALKPNPELSIILKKIGRKLAKRYKRRYSHGGRKINLRRTIRANIQNGGTIMQLVREKRRMVKPRLIVMTDISSSTMHATRLFLNIIWHAKEVFQDIRFFEFISSCIEVTTAFKRADNVNEGISEAIRCWDKVVEGKENSNYYQAIKEFGRLTNGGLSSRTTIIMLGDMRDWLGPWKEEIPLSSILLGKLRKKVNKILVLNPERFDLWDTGDSIVKFAEREGVVVYEITTLQKLLDVLMDL